MRCALMAGFLPGYESGLNHKDPTTEPSNGDKAADERLVHAVCTPPSLAVFCFLAFLLVIKKKIIIIYYPGKKGSNEAASSCS